MLEVASIELSPLIPPEEDDALEPTASADPEPGFDDAVDLAQIPSDIISSYEVHTWRNAATILSQRHAVQYAEVLKVLRAFRLCHSHILKTDESGQIAARGGGRKSLIAESLDGPLSSLGWNETLFTTQVNVEAKKLAKRPKIGKRGQPTKATLTFWEPFERINFDAPTHKVDCYKSGVALEVEWNNKNTFFDRDLNNFRLLFELRAVQVGIIITRCDELDELFARFLPKAKARERYGSTTTRMSKLIPLIKGGGAGGCPVLVFGIKSALYDENC